jgi:hypothetical protein
VSPGPDTGTLRQEAAYAVAAGLALVAVEYWRARRSR